MTVFMQIYAFGPFTSGDYFSFPSLKEAKAFARDYWTKYYSSLNDMHATIWKAEPEDWQEMLIDQEMIKADPRMAPQDFDMGYPDEEWTPVIPKDSVVFYGVNRIHTEPC